MQRTRCQLRKLLDRCLLSNNSRLHEDAQYLVPYPPLAPTRACCLSPANLPSGNVGGKPRKTYGLEHQTSAIYREKTPRLRGRSPRSALRGQQVEIYPTSSLPDLAKPVINDVRRAWGGRFAKGDSTPERVVEVECLPGYPSRRRSAV